MAAVAQYSANPPGMRGHKLWTTGSELWISLWTTGYARAAYPRIAREYGTMRE